MFKACSRCGKVHDSRFKCNAGKIYQSTNERALRNKNAWHTKSLQIREQAQYLCEVCRDQGKITFDNLEVHHIIPLREDDTLLLEDSNLICLCQEHHRQAEAEKISREYLMRLARERINIPLPSKDD